MPRLPRLLICGIAMLTLAALAPATHASAFREAIQEGEALRKSSSYDQAIAAFDKAFASAANNTERAIALGKKAYVLAYDQRDYMAAKPIAERALALPDIHAVAQVTAMRVKAVCLMKGEKDLAAAAETLTEALELDGVDWAKPSLALMLGDCYRLSAKPKEAIEAYSRVFDMDNARTVVQAIAHLNIGMAYQYGLRQNQSARTAYEQAVALDSNLQRNVDTHLSKMP